MTDQEFAGPDTDTFVLNTEYSPEPVIGLNEKMDIIAQRLETLTDRVDSLGNGINQIGNMINYITQTVATVGQQLQGGGGLGALMGMLGGNKNQENNSNG